MLSQKLGHAVAMREEERMAIGRKTSGHGVQGKREGVAARGQRVKEGKL